jgi:two-component system response regulator NreC
VVSAAKIRVLVADDHGMVRAGLRSLIDLQPDMAVIAEAADAADAVEKTKSMAPDVVLLDLEMPQGGGLRALRMLSAEFPALRSLVVTMHDDLGNLRAALEAGASGYITKKSADTELLQAIRVLQTGRTYVDPNLANGTKGPLPAPNGAAPRGSEKPLSAREREALFLTARGHTNREIAHRLGVGIKTAETYKARLMAKLGLRTRAELVRYAIAVGILGDRPL